MQCKFCNENLSNKHTLKIHQNTAKYCLKIQAFKNREKTRRIEKKRTILTGLINIMDSYPESTYNKEKSQELKDRLYRLDNPYPPVEIN